MKLSTRALRSVLSLPTLALLCAATLAQAPPTARTPAAAAAPEPDYHSGHSTWVKVAIFSPDGRLLASGDLGGDVFVWETASGKVLRRLHSQMAISDLAFSPDSRLLAIASAKPLVVWDVETGRQVFSLSGDPGRDPDFSDLAFSPDGKRLAAIAHSYDPKTKQQTLTVVVWEMKSGALTDELPALHVPPSGSFSNVPVAFSPDGKLLAAGSDDGLKLWDTSTWKELRTLVTPASYFGSSATFSADGRWLATSAAGGAVALWQTSTWQLARVVPSGFARGIAGFALSPDGRWLAATEASSEEKTIFWEAASGQIVSTMKHANTNSIPLFKRFGFSPDSKLAALPSYARDIQLVDPASGSVVRTLAGAPVLGSYQSFRLLHGRPPRPSATPPPGMPFDVASLPRDWQFWTVEADVENHSDTEQYLRAPTTEIRLLTANAKGQTEARYPVVSLLPAGSGMTGFVVQFGKTDSIPVGRKYVLRGPYVAAKFAPHQKLTLQLIFIAPSKYSADQVSLSFGD
jgi:WD40 repeat protein